WSVRSALWTVAMQAMCLRRCPALPLRPATGPRPRPGRRGASWFFASMQRPHICSDLLHLGGIEPGTTQRWHHGTALRVLGVDPGGDHRGNAGQAAVMVQPLLGGREPGGGAQHSLPRLAVAREAQPASLEDLLTRGDGGAVGRSVLRIQGGDGNSEREQDGRQPACHATYSRRPLSPFGTE